MRHSVAMYSSAFETAGGMFIFAIIFLSLVLAEVHYREYKKKIHIYFYRNK